MKGVTESYLKKSIQHEIEANKDYMKHAKGKDGKFLKEIAHDERSHRKILIRKLKKLQAAARKKKK
jgi:rubrerythrin